LSSLGENRMNDNNDKMFISFGISLSEDSSQFCNKMPFCIFTDFFIAEAWVATRISHSFSSSRQLWFSVFKTILEYTTKVEKLTWIVKSQDLSSNN
jgi:hypothetical protein